MGRRDCWVLFLVLGIGCESEPPGEPVGTLAVDWDGDRLVPTSGTASSGSLTQMALLIGDAVSECGDDDIGSHLIFIDLFQGDGTGGFVRIEPGTYRTMASIVRNGYGQVDAPADLTIEVMDQVHVTGRIDATGRTTSGDVVTASGTFDVVRCAPGIPTGPGDDSPHGPCIGLNAGRGTGGGTAVVAGALMWLGLRRRRKTPAYRS